MLKFWITPRPRARPSALSSPLPSPPLPLRAKIRRLAIYLSIRLSACLSIRPTVCLSVCFLVCLICATGWLSLTQLCGHLFVWELHCWLVCLSVSLCVGHHVSYLSTAYVHKCTHLTYCWVVFWNPCILDLWLEWIQDEIPLACIPEQKKNIVSLFERAVQDYQCKFSLVFY